MHKIIKIKSLIIIAAAICILSFSFDFKQVSAESKGSSSGVDVVFVIDSSRSMTKSDPTGLTSEAMKMFIDMCHTKGDKGGMVAYSGDIVREYKVKELNSETDKLALKNTLINLNLGNWTDIGLGLKRAVNILKEGNTSGNKPIIILLSDGKNDPERNASESKQDLTEALNAAKLNGYPIYTIGLNADGTVDKNELLNISKETKGINFITNTADELPQIIRQIFADNFSLKVLHQEILTGNGDFQQVKINIPDNNEVESNISILSSKPVEIKLSNPKGEFVKIPSDKFIYSKSNVYSLLKLISPEKGSWVLYVKGSNADKINISLISNYDLKAYLLLSPENIKYKGDKVLVTSYLESNGQKLEDDDIYSTAKGFLVINDLDKSEIKEFPMEYKNNEFAASYTLSDKDRYELKVRIEASGFIRESEVKALGAENRKPALSINFGSISLWNNKSKKITLSQYFTDADNDKLKFSILNESPDKLGAVLNGDILSLQGKKIGRSTITIVCDDSKGGTVSEAINISTFFISYIICVIILIILIAALYILIRKVRNRKGENIPGQVTIQIKGSSGANQPYYKSLSSLKSNFSLHELLDLNPEFKETENIMIKAKKGVLIITNKSQYELESYGKKIESSKRLVMKNNYKITIRLSEKNISINIQYFNS
jgi:Ca-activated chloride channel homolog